MSSERIYEGILAKFSQSRIVFWQDEDREFVNQIDSVREFMQEQDIVVLHTDTESLLEVKHRIELLNPEVRFLLYSNAAVNEPKRDWLYDIRQYAAHFYADSSAIILNELGMRMEFRQDISRFKKFFSSNQRYTRLKKILPENADKTVLEQALIAVLLKVDQVDLQAILHQVFASFAESEEAGELLLAELEKFDLLFSLWTMLVEEFGFIEPELWADKPKRKPSIADLLTKLLVTDCYHALQASGADVAKSQYAQNLSGHLLPVRLTQDDMDSLPSSVQTKLQHNAAKRAAVVSFVSNWRTNRNLSESYNAIAGRVAADLSIASKLIEFSQPEHLMQVETFKEADQVLLKTLAKNLPVFSYNDVDDWIKVRLRGHWCHATDNLAPMYKALRAARELYQLKNNYPDGFSYSSPQAFYTAYQQELYRFDYAYRIFCENCIELNKVDGGDLLKALGLVDDIEQLYVDWYLHDLAIAWDKLVDQFSLLDEWRIQGINNQFDFYRNEVQSILMNTTTKKVFVIISDALRYEVASEITQQISDEKRFKADLRSQLGVVPSYTQLGMGSLLPHARLTAHIGNKVEYKADGISVHGHDNRDKILKQHRGAAFKADDVLRWTTQECKSKVEDLEVIYIFHDVIDSIGDKQGTESQTFEAARSAIKEIKNLISRVIDRLKGSRVLITADHGFLFKTSGVTDSDKSLINIKCDGAVEPKKRYVLGTNLPSGSHHWKGQLSVTAGIDGSAGDEVEFVVPRGTNRFNFVGGARFVHGGMMPQEICVPIIDARVLGKQAQTKLAKQKVGVVPLNSPVRIVSNIDRILLLQTDAVGDKFKARELQIWIESPEGKRVSSIEVAVFDSASEKLDERKRNVPVKLEGSGFDRHLSYKLMMKDSESGELLQAHSVTIDLAIENDFF